MKSVRIAAVIALGLGAWACAHPTEQRQQTSAALYGDYLIGRYADLSRSDGDATTRYLSALKLAPGDEALLKGAVESALAAGDVSRAALAADLAHRQGSESELARLTRAAIALRDGRYSAASVAASDAPGAALDRAAAQILYAWALAAQGKLDDALRTISLSSTRSDLMFSRLSATQRAALLDYAGRTDAALDGYRDAESSGLRGQTVLMHGALLERTARKDEAAALYRWSLSNGADDPAARAALDRLEAGGRPPAAPSAAEGAALGLFTLASSLVGQADVDFYLPYLTLAQALDPRLDNAWLVSGEALRQIGKPDASRAALKKISAESPWYEVAQTRVAWSYNDEENSQEAISIAQAAATQTNGRLARVTLGDMLRADDQWDKAEAVYTSLIAEAEPPKAEDWSLFFARAACLQELDRWQEAEADLKRALTLMPNQPDVLNFLGYSWVSKGMHLQEGLGLLEKAVALRPRSGYIVDSLGWAKFQLGEYEEAVEIIERAVSLEPQDAELNDHLGDAYWRVGRRIEARFQWRRALDQKPKERQRAVLEEKLKTGLPALTPAAASAPH